MQTRSRAPVLAALTAPQLVDLPGSEDQQHNLRRIDRMLQRMGG